MTRRVIQAAVLALAALSSTSQAAPVVTHEHDHATNVPHNLFAAKFVGGASVSSEHTGSLAGPSLVYERELIRHWLLAEASVGLLFSDADKFIPVELIFKKPFVLSDMFELYVGIGPSLILHPHEGMHYIWGAVATLGTYIWFGTHLGMLVEFDYNLCSEDHHAVNEFEGGVGLAFRF